MRFSKLVIIGVLLVVAGSVLIYQDQSNSKTRACKRRIQRSRSAVCTWTVVGETRVWSFEFDEEKEDKDQLFSEFRRAMLQDLKAPREEGTSEVGPEYLICIKDGAGEHPFYFEINIGDTSWIECGGGTYPNQGHTVEFLRKHEKRFQLQPRK